MSYWRFAAMIITSTAVMFILMYLNTYLFSHLFWSETRAYMAVLMGATMAIIMLAFMLAMYSNKTINAVIFICAAIVFAGSLWLVRSQVTIGDQSYMRAMIPHHSIAIMTSSRSNLSDPRVRKLADEIIYAQDKEIAEMRYLINDIEAGGDAVADEESGMSDVVSLDEALSSAKIASLDLEFMTDEEIAQSFPDGAVCLFRFTQDSSPVLAIGPQLALVKISSDLVSLTPDRSGSSGSALSADGISVEVSAPHCENTLDAGGKQAEANLTLQLDAGLRAGYRGFYECTT